MAIGLSYITLVVVRPVYRKRVLGGGKRANLGCMQDEFDACELLNGPPRAWFGAHWRYNEHEASGISHARASKERHCDIRLGIYIRAIRLLIPE